MKLVNDRQVLIEAFVERFPRPESHQRPNLEDGFSSCFGLKNFRPVIDDMITTQRNDFCRWPSDLIAQEERTRKYFVDLRIDTLQFVNFDLLTISNIVFKHCGRWITMLKNDGRNPHFESREHFEIGTRLRYNDLDLVGLTVFKNRLR